MNNPVKVKTDFKGWKTVFAAVRDDLHSDLFALSGKSSFIDRHKGGITYATGIQSKVTKLADREIRRLIDEVTRLWREEASSILQGTALQEYLKSIKVEFVKGSLRLTLFGWESLSRDLGWAPSEGGLVEGLGKYDGQLHDMKPMLLAGASSKVIPMRLQGTKSELKSKLTKHFEQGLMSPSVPSTMPGLDAHASINKQVSSAALASKSMQSVYTPRPNRFSEGPGPANDPRKGRKFTKSILEGAKGVGSLRSTSRAAISSFFVFRTVSDGSVRTPKAGKKKKMTKREKLAAMRARNMRYKWFTKGRAPLDLLSKMQDVALKLLREAMTLKAISDAMKKVT